jgi:dTDP-glucose pyrophosphorylase
MQCINGNSRGVALILDESGYLIHTVTDGDIRRAVLTGSDLQSPISEVLNRREVLPSPNAVTALAGTPTPELIFVMREHGIHHLPLLDEAGRVVDVALLDDLVRRYDLPIQAVVMAGGFGTRLMPLTDTVPKPMLPVGDKPILERIVNQLQQSGIRRVNFTTHYRPDVIRDHFGDGEKFGIEIEYISEEEPRGTAGALSMLEVSDEPIMVMNGDVLTRVDFRAMHAFHREHKADLTVAVRQYDMKVPYGVINCDGPTVKGIEEKPVYKVLVNAGIYLLESSAHRSIPRTTERFDMTDLIEQLTRDGRNVIAFPIVEYWMDIGHHVDYAQAQEDVKTWEGQP